MEDQKPAYRNFAIMIPTSFITIIPPIEHFINSLAVLPIYLEECVDIRLQVQRSYSILQSEYNPAIIRGSEHRFDIRSVLDFESWLDRERKYLFPTKMEQYGHMLSMSMPKTDFSELLNHVQNEEFFLTGGKRGRPTHRWFILLQFFNANIRRLFTSGIPTWRDLPKMSFDVYWHIYSELSYIHQHHEEYSKWLPNGYSFTSFK